MYILEIKTRKQFEDMFKISPIHCITALWGTSQCGMLSLLSALGGPSLLVGGFRLDSVLIWAVLACPTRVAQEAVITCVGHENNMELGFQVSAALGSSVEACQVWLFRVLRLSN